MLGVCQADEGFDLLSMGLDSVELILYVEEEFGIAIDDESVEQIETVGDLHACVLRKLSGAESPSVLSSAPLGEEVWRRLTRLLVEEFGADPAEVTPEAGIVRDLRIN